MNYSKAPEEMVELVATIVEEHHEHLDGMSIAVICRDKAAKRHGRVIYATAGKMSKKINVFLEKPYSFIIIVALDEWEELEYKQRVALIDHELCHCQVDEDGKPKIVGHDLEEFACIIRRHGAWWRKDENVEDPVTQALLFRQGVNVEAPDLKKVDAGKKEQKKDKKAS